ncbi:hypothetical protein [Sphingobacterium sp. Ag1]|uniref:hypothetical protein n=1 Tax=Sphingobacterium sp. Ag1 TaxID=1643451 RepID=UPI0012E05865|nr:hypothetical protein [Sphingobacterium sp. Ag1]
MQRTYPDTIKLQEKPRVVELYTKLGEFASWMKRPKDAQEIQKDTRKSLPPTMLPMPF